MRRFIVGSCMCLAAASVAIASSASAQSLGGCELKGTASFAPGLNTSSQAFAYGFEGALSGCKSSESGAPAGGEVEAGKTLTEQVKNSITGATDSVTYQEPAASGSGGCASSTTSGVALVTWSDGSHTVISYSTVGALAAVRLSGSVAESITLNATNAKEGDPSTYTISTSRFAGDSSNGLLAFQPPEPTACNSSAGTSTAAISGLVSLGSS